MIGGKFVRRTGGAITGWARCFARQRTATYLVWYLLSILAFAAFYCALPSNNFYAPFIGREPRTSQDTKAFRQFLTDKMSQSAQTWSLSNYVDFNMADVALARVEQVASTRSVRLFLITKGNPGAGKPPQTLTLDLATSGMPEKGGFCHPVTVTPDAGPPPDPALLDVLFHDAPGCTLTPYYVGLDSDEEDYFHNYTAGAAGEPKLLSGYGLRMILFSIMTITTTVFGDVIPLTRTARLAVAIEPLWGLLILCLAVRAIVRKGRSEA
ncbi:MAG TPA: potassium channel family protein [Sphingomonas sp.]|uniref:potassium channel family protein n=1 Tax=Sphingomonas sp. TaxID=28214 RepID=UPI002C4A5F45|nr:potassium channel family protein [Sphingomonas sp.]HMI20522.1 potassium channel family protein [Sphingomonas sp.]